MITEALEMDWNSIAREEGSTMMELSAEEMQDVSGGRFRVKYAIEIVDRIVRIMHNIWDMWQD